MADKRVKATQDGYDGSAYRKAGDVFLVRPEVFDKAWMEEVNEPIFTQTPEAQGAKSEGGAIMAQDLGEALADAGADPEATADAVGKPADLPKAEEPKSRKK